MRDAPLIEPRNLMITTEAVLPHGWTKYYSYRTGRYREVVVERRRNPFALLGPVGVVHLSMHWLLTALTPETAPGVVAAVRSGVTGISPLTVLSVALISSWIVAGIVVRLRTRETERFNRDRMYPPAGYWEGGNDDV